MKELIYYDSCLRKEYENLLFDVLRKHFTNYSYCVELFSLKIYDPKEFGEKSDSSFNVVICCKYDNTMYFLEHDLKNFQPLEDMKICWKVIYSRYFDPNSFDEFFEILELENQDRIETLINSEFEKYLAEYPWLKSKIKSVILDDYSYACEMTKNQLYLEFDHLKNSYKYDDLFLYEDELIEPYKENGAKIAIIKNPCTKDRKILYGEKTLMNLALKNFEEEIVMLIASFSLYVSHCQKLFAAKSELHEEISEFFDIGSACLENLEILNFKEFMKGNFNSLSASQNKKIELLIKEYENDDDFLNVIDEFEDFMRNMNKVLFYSVMDFFRR